MHMLNYAEPKFTHFLLQFTQPFGLILHKDLELSQIVQRAAICFTVGFARAFNLLPFLGDLRRTHNSEALHFVYLVMTAKERRYG